MRRLQSRRTLTATPLPRDLPPVEQFQAMTAAAQQETMIEVVASKFQPRTLFTDEPAPPRMQKLASDFADTLGPA